MHAGTQSPNRLFQKLYFSLRSLDALLQQGVGDHHLYGRNCWEHFQFSNICLPQECTQGLLVRLAKVNVDPCVESAQALELFEFSFNSPELKAKRSGNVRMAIEIGLSLSERDESFQRVDCFLP